MDNLGAEVGQIGSLSWSNQEAGIGQIGRLKLPKAKLELPKRVKSAKNKAGMAKDKAGSNKMKLELPKTRLKLLWVIKSRILKNAAETGWKTEREIKDEAKL